MEKLGTLTIQYTTLEAPIITGIMGPHTIIRLGRQFKRMNLVLEMLLVVFGVMILLIMIKEKNK